MTQTSVNFLVDTNPGNVNPTLALVPRIFDAAVSPDAQTLYDALINQIQANLVPNATATQIQAVSDAIKTLNAWSQLRLVDNSGPNQTQAQTYQIEGTSVLVDANGNPLAPNLQPPPLNTLTAAQLANGPVFDINEINPNEATELGLSFTTVSTTMDQYTGSDVDQLIRAFRSAGWDPTEDLPGQISANAGAAIANLTGADASVYGVVDVGSTTGLLTKAINDMGQAQIVGDTSSQSQSIQQVLMVDYIGQGNQILYNEMSQLEQAVNQNQSALSYLNSLQSLMNQKNPQQFVLNLEQLNGVVLGTDNAQSAYNTYEQSTYDQSINAITNFQNDGTLESYLSTQNPSATSLSITQEAFATIQSSLSTVGSYSVSQITQNLTYLIGQLTALSGGTSSTAPQGGLIQSLQTVLNDFNGLTGSNPIQQWIQDAQAGATGNYQNDLNNAVTSSQSFNDTEREELSQVMFVFEEFYKSADTLLSSLTQLIQKMADGIASQ